MAATDDSAKHPGDERTRVVAELAADCSYGVVVEPDGTVREEWTAGDFERLTGYSHGELAPRDWAKVVHPDDRANVRGIPSVAEGGGTDRMDLRIIRKDGEVRWVNRSRRVWRDPESGAFHVIGTVQDVTDRVAANEERHHLEGYLRHLQKIEALGTLAGGVAHDFNNLLYVVIGNAELALRKLPPDSPARANVEEILSIARRGADITAKILAFNRPDLVEPRTSDLDEVTAEAISLLRATIPTSIAIELVSRGPCAVRLGATDLHQILINLVTNASHAMPNGGRIRVVIDPVAVAPGDGSAAGVPAGGHTRLIVSDTGEGMPPEVAGRIFEPRFTTRPSQASGMGLAVVRGIVQRYGGSITCTTSVGEGTTFEVLLPAAAPPAGPIADADADAAGYGRILFVDDEPDVVRMVREVLESLGYEVDGRTSSRQALEAFRAAPARYDLVLTDQTMPELNGDALVREIRRVRPEMPVILCSGYHERVRPEVVSELAIQACLQKPIDIDTLSRAVRGVLALAPHGA